MLHTLSLGSHLMCFWNSRARLRSHGQRQREATKGECRRASCGWLKFLQWYIRVSPPRSIDYWRPAQKLHDSRHREVRSRRSLETKYICCRDWSGNHICRRNFSLLVLYLVDCLLNPAGSASWIVNSPWNPFQSSMSSKRGCLWFLQILSKC